MQKKLKRLYMGGVQTPDDEWHKGVKDGGWRSKKRLEEVKQIGRAMAWYFRDNMPRVVETGYLDGRGFFMGKKGKKQLSLKVEV